MKLCHIALAVAVFPGLALAQGGPPLLTDDPATPGEGHYEINTAITANYRQTAQSFATPLVDMNFGMGERGQLKFEVPIATDRASGSSATTNVGSMLVGWKQRFHDQDGTLPLALSVYPQISSGSLSRSKSFGFARRDVRYLLPMEAAHTFGRLSLNVEVGYVLRAQNPDARFYGAAIGWKTSDGTEWLAERHRILSADIADQEDIVNMGLRLPIQRHLGLLVAVGSSPHRAADYTRLNAYLGLQFNN